MPKQKAQYLISQLHDMYGDNVPSDQQRRLLAELELHVHPVGTKDSYEPVPLETLERLVEEVEMDHPRTAAVARELLETLKNIGV